MKKHFKKMGEFHNAVHGSKHEISERIKDTKVILVSKKGKIPAEKDWVNKGKATTDPVVQKWIKEGGNLGVLTGNGIIVFDADSPMGEELARKLPKTLVVGTSTKNGFRGKHFYFKSGVEKKIILFDKKEHIGEVQARGQFVVAPGSIHPSGAVYEIIEDRDMAELSEKDLLDVVSNCMNTESNKTKIKDIMGGLKEGNRNDSGYRLGMFNRKNGGDFIDTLALLENWNRKNVPPLPDMEIREIVKSVYLTPDVDMEIFEKRVQEEDKKNKKTQLSLPKVGKSKRAFAYELGEEIKDKGSMFFRQNSRDIVEVGKVKNDKDGKEKYIGFFTMMPNRFVTFVEKYVHLGVFENLEKDSRKPGVFEFREKSMSPETAKTLLCSDIIQSALPGIKRIFTVPIPIIHEGELTFPKRGYDERFLSWLPFDSPEISEPDMPLEEAKKLIYKMLSEFCFSGEQDYINGVAAILSPFLKGLYPQFNERPPVFFFEANRERAGKDYFAGVIGHIYDGCAIEDSPISGNDKNGNSSEELRKKITSALIGGRKRMHFANNKGFINNCVFEQASTSRVWTDRLLGKNDFIKFENELDFSLSGNTGVTYTADFRNRCRFVRFLYGEEDANSRKFKNSDLHGWVEKNRSLILSALYSLVRNWVDNGKPKGSVPFTSFPRWADVCGGIMENAGYGTPCKPDEESLGVDGDRDTSNMKQLFEMCFEKYPDQYITRGTITDLIKDETEGIFSFLDFDSKKDQMRFGVLMLKYIGRTLSDIRLEVKDRKVRGQRKEFIFTKTNKIVDKSIIFGSDYPEVTKEITVSSRENGNLGNLGNLESTLDVLEGAGVKNIESRSKATKVTKVTNPTPETSKILVTLQSKLKKIPSGEHHIDFYKGVGFTDEEIKKCIESGLVLEVRPGILRKV